MIKYASKDLLAIKIAFINEIANLCEKAGTDVRSVANVMDRDGCVGTQFPHPGHGY